MSDDFSEEVPKLKSDIEIAQEITPRMKTISEIAKKIGLTEDDIEHYGKYKAKVTLDVLKRMKDKPNGKLICVTAITPTDAGEGKTVTSIGITQGLGKLGKNVILCLREPSLGPVFGIKGGATGGGYSQIYPMWDVDLHFTGDIHAVGSAHNLLAAIIDNHIAKGNKLNIDPTRIVWRRVVDMNDRALRKIIIGLGGMKEGGVPRETGFDITVASEIMAILALSKDIGDLKDRLGKIIVAYTYDGKPVFAKDLKVVGAMTLLLKDAIKPNLIQTLEGQPAFVHLGPFANIAHGNNSIVATMMALKLADYVVTESGFGADLGFEKFCDIVSRVAGVQPNMVVLVVSIRALHMHGGVPKENVKEKNVVALKKGFKNLDKHIENIRKFGLPLVVAINRFANDDIEELELVKRHCEELGVRAAYSEVVLKGGEGGIELAKAALETLEKEKSNFKPIYDLNLPIKEKIKIIATEIYGAKDVVYTPEAEETINILTKLGYDKLPINMAKTQRSITDDPKIKGAPRDWKLTVREVRISAGAGFIVPLTGQIMTMPGLPEVPAAEKIDITDDGYIIGLN